MVQHYHFYRYGALEPCPDFRIFYHLHAIAGIKCSVEFDTPTLTIGMAYGNYLLIFLGKHYTSLPKSFSYLQEYHPCRHRDVHSKFHPGVAWNESPERHCDDSRLETIRHITQTVKTSFPVCFITDDSLMTIKRENWIIIYKAKIFFTCSIQWPHKANYINVRCLQLHQYF